MMHLILEKRPDISARDLDGRTALDRAAVRTRNQVIVELLLDYCADTSNDAGKRRMSKDVEARSFFPEEEIEERPSKSPTQSLADERMGERLVGKEEKAGGDKAAGC